MANCLGYFNKNRSKLTTVLVATSGDTGAAVPNVLIIPIPLVAFVIELFVRYVSNVTVWTDLSRKKLKKVVLNEFHFGFAKNLVFFILISSEDGYLLKIE